VTGLALRNPIAILMICVALAVFSLVVTPRMAVDTFPELTPPVLIIGTLSPGLGAKDVEKTISWRLEKYVSATPGVDHVESLSRNGFSVIYVWLKWGTDLNAAQTLVQSQAGFAMAAIPKSLGVLPPFVLQYDPSNAPVCEVVVSGAGYTGPQLYDYAFNDIEPLLEGISGVASAAPYGGQLRQINVVVDPIKAQARRVTANDIAAAAARSNALLPTGELLAPRFDANVYTNAIPKRVETIGEATVKVVGDKPVLIRDVARVEDSGTPQTEAVAVDGKDAVYLSVLRIPGGNTIDIVDAVKKIVEGLHDLPPGMHAKVYFDQSTFVRSAYHGLKKEIVQALVLIAMVILLFLQSVRGTIIVSVAIPLSFAITLIVLYAAGETLNAFTLGGLTLAMGRLVDDAVVVLEAIHRHRRLGFGPAEAALKGTNSVALPVLASTLTTMAVLLPVLLLAGLARKLFAPLAITVGVAMLASYFVSMAVTPVACRYFLGHTEHGRVGRAVEGLIDRVAEGYSRTLRTVLPYRWAVIAASFVLVVGAGWTASRLPSTFFPEIDESMDTLYVRLAPGISVTDAAATMADMGRAITRELPPGTVEMSIANNGMPQNARALLTNTNVAPNTGTLQLAFSDAEHRTLSQAELAVRIRDIVTREFPGVEVLQYPGGLVASVFANGYTAPFVVEVHNDNLAELNEEAQAVADVARTVAGVRDVKVSLQNDYPEVHVDTDREMAGLVGTSEKEAAETTLQATLGNINTPGVWIDSENGQSYYVVTSYDASHVQDTQSLGDHRPGGSPPRLRRRPPRARAGLHRAQPPGEGGPHPHADRGARHRLGRGRPPARAPPRRAHPARRVAVRRSGGPHAHDVRRPRPRPRPGGDGGVHDHGVAVQVAAVAVRHAVHHPCVAGRDRPRADGGGSGVLHHGADGHPDGHRDRRVQRHPPRRRREPPLRRRGGRQGGRHRLCGQVAVRAHRHDEPGDGHRPHPDRHGSGAWLGGQPAARAGGGRRAHVVDGPVAVPRAGHVPLLRAASSGRGRSPRAGASGCRGARVIGQPP
jgi:multidrug efflux pump subunit AcrB